MFAVMLASSPAVNLGSWGWVVALASLPLVAMGLKWERKADRLILAALVAVVGSLIFANVTEAVPVDCGDCCRILYWWICAI